MRACCFLVDPPLLDDRPRIAEAVEEVLVEAFVSEPAVPVRD